MKHFEIQKTPAPKGRHSNTSSWKDKFESMRVGEWFTLPQKDYNRVQAACSAYLKGRYSLRQHPRRAGTYVMEKTK
jgi:hypothetical protein